jgi:hypothetical protein
MRVLQTQFIFDQDQIEIANPSEEVPEFPAVSCAWFKITDKEAARPSAWMRRIAPGQIMAFGGKGFVSLEEAPNEVDVRRFLDGCLYDAVYTGSLEQGDVRNPGVVDYLLEQTVILEESPPKAIPLKGLIGAGSIMSIGAAVGYKLAPGTYPLLLLITVPVGIIVIGSAAGVATAMQHGLHEVIRKTFFDRKQKSKR